MKRKPRARKGARTGAKLAIQPPPEIPKLGSVVYSPNTRKTDRFKSVHLRITGEHAGRVAGLAKDIGLPEQRIASLIWNAGLHAIDAFPKHAAQVEAVKVVLKSAYAARHAKRDLPLKQRGEA